MDVIHRRCAGLDVHQAEIAACIRITPEGASPRALSRRFRTDPAGLSALRDWLVANEVTHVALEATGVYWMPVFNTLEAAGLDQTVCNAHHVKNVPGRKTDQSDAAWLAQLIAMGLLRKSYVPPAEVRQVRELTRARHASHRSGSAGSAARPGRLAATPAPAAPQGTAPRAAAAARERPTIRLEGVAAGKVALVADDDAAVRQLVATVLRTMGCLVLEAGDGLSALATAREGRPDVAVLDAMMPGMHGFEVCRAIKGDRALRATRVVLCSAIYRGTVGADAQVAFGADAFLEKPFRLEELSRILKVALVGPVAAETAEERAARERSLSLWRAAAEALTQDQVPEAARLARDAASADPWSAEAHYYLGHALARQGLLLEAVAAYERAAELRPDVDATHQCLAQLHERLGFQKSARESWARAIETCRDPKRRKHMQARLMAPARVETRAGSARRGEHTGRGVAPLPGVPRATR